MQFEAPSLSQITEDFLFRLRLVLGETDEIISLHTPQFDSEEKGLVVECLDSTFVSTFGPYVELFEQKIKHFTGASHAIAVANGTSALQVALFLAGVSAGDEVIVPALSFIATANAVSYLGATPHFIDVDEATMGLSASSLETYLQDAIKQGGDLINPLTGKKISAIVPMHTLGHPTKIQQIVAIADRYGLPVVEDAAESLGSFIDGKHTGTFGLLGILSFNGNKIITTGGGGVILTSSSVLAQRARHLTTTAKVPHPWQFEHDEIGWNFRMPNLNAALGVAQFGKLPLFLEKKRALAKKYREAFSNSDFFEFFDEPDGSSSNYWLCAVQLKIPSIELRNFIIDAAIEAGYQVRPLWNLLNRQKMYIDAPSENVSNADLFQSTVLCLPSSPKLVDKFL